jgi:hypothetical protein
MAWVSESDIENATLNQEVRDWCDKALAAAPGWTLPT